MLKNKTKHVNTNYIIINKNNNKNILLINKIKRYSEKLMEDSLPGHNFLHISRVYNNAVIIAKKEKADLLVVEAAALLHDVGRKYELENPKINHADKSAELALPFLKKLAKLKKSGFPSEKIPAVLYAIRNHRFTKGIVPETLEARVLQDADKLDALGAIGIMRCFSHGTVKGRQEYNPEDPVCRKRLALVRKSIKKGRLKKIQSSLEFADKKYSIDHFYRKLFKLRGRMFTKTAKRIAAKRERIMKVFLNELGNEIEGSDL